MTNASKQIIIIMAELINQKSKRDELLFAQRAGDSTAAKTDMEEFTTDKGCCVIS